MKKPSLLIVVALIAGAAIVHGAVTQRWSVFAPNPERTTRLHALEIRFEDWQPSEVPTEMPNSEKSIATARRYVSASTQQSAVVTIISGIPGSVSTHTPDICYVGSGYKCLRGPRKDSINLPGGTAEFYIADFEKKTATRQERVRIRWAWSADGTWIAPDNPRWQFAKRINAVPELYKLYVATPLPDSNGEDKAHEDEPQTQAFVAAAWSQFAAGFNR
jgi:hypothetical protein